VENVIQTYAIFEDNNTNPGFVIIKKQPSFKIYEKAVRGIVTLSEIEQKLKSLEAYYQGYKNRRGLIGATASVAWSPNYDKTYELIAYRKKIKWGTKRSLDDNSVKEMDKTCLSTFDNYDYGNLDSISELKIR